MRECIINLTCQRCRSRLTAERASARKNLYTYLPGRGRINGTGFRLIERRRNNLSVSAEISKR